MRPALRGVGGLHPNLRTVANRQSNPRCKDEPQTTASSHGLWYAAIPSSDSLILKA